MTRATKPKAGTPPAPTIPAIPPADVLSRLAALKTTPTADLKQQWRQLFAAEPPPYNRRFLESRLAYRIQELAYGGLKPETIQRLEALGEQLDGGNPVLRRIRGDDKPITGTRLIREYQGVEHSVTVLHDGYEYQGRPYQSLSSIARHHRHALEWLAVFRPEESEGRGMKRKPAANAVMPATVRKIRAAVYTRKSSEEGLDMEFNSLDAQREACEAYIASQRSEGWVLVPDRYDDGGVSGGTLERPALRRLLADIERGRLDVIVCYKLDRLSRALMDFAKLVEVFDANSVTFVSVTQSFNTTTSMGRLTLNILLSFAQFEREVIGERIRDKVAASRARGIWMGGFVPLGYDARDRKLLVNDAEAALVRRIFEGFVETESGTKLVQALRVEGATTKRGRAFTKSDIYRVLSNRTYLGEAMHKGKSHPGEHVAIVPQAMWDAAHALLTISPRTRANRTRCQTPSLLRGLIFGSDGRAMSPTHARGRRGQQYRYYVSQSVLKGSAADGPAIARISAAEIEGAVIAQVRGLLRQPEVVLGAWRAARASAPDMTEEEARLALERLDPLWEELFPAEQARIIRLLVDRVDIGAGGADVRLKLEGLASLARDLAAPATEPARVAA